MVRYAFRRFRVAGLCVCAVLLVLAGLCGRVNAQETASPTSSPVEVTFILNDSVIKDKCLPDVTVGIGVSETGELMVQGKTDSRGRFTAELQPGRYYASFGKRGYIPVANTVVDVEADNPIWVTVTLSMLMEEVGLGAQRRVQVVLNWGSGGSVAKDLDAHMLCSRAGRLDHIYFGDKTHDDGEHKASLDVDDTDWGGPETITLVEPLPGTYSYWVYNYSGLPSRLDASEATVRVIINDKVAGEYRLAPGTPTRSWRPFKYISVDQAGNSELVWFTPAELASRANFIFPEEAPFASSGGDEFGWITVVVSMLFNLVFIYVVYLIIRKVIRAKVTPKESGPV
ncbi:MAG TPA: hypothetical protein PLU72_16850 [Candidatus Ozemobacteraceae bacterium]|nr:hypothetical protein [Candidatus Ozemobacteraceae bacterium]